MGNYRTRDQLKRDKFSLTAKLSIVERRLEACQEEKMQLQKVIANYHRKKIITTADL